MHISIFQTIFQMKVISRIFLQPTDKEEIANIISSLNSSKAFDPSNIPCRILFLLKHEILKQLRTAKQLLFLRMIQNQIIATIVQSPCYQILKKYFLNNNNITHNLQFGFKQQYFTSHALINTTENIRKALDDGNIG